MIDEYLRNREGRNFQIWSQPSNQAPQAILLPSTPSPLLPPPWSDHRLRTVIIQPTVKGREGMVWKPMKFFKNIQQYFYFNNRPYFCGFFNLYHFSVFINHIKKKVLFHVDFCSSGCKNRRKIESKKVNFLKCNYTVSLLSVISFKSG